MTTGNNDQSRGFFSFLTFPACFCPQKSRFCLVIVVLVRGLSRLVRPLEKYQKFRECKEDILRLCFLSERSDGH